MSTDYSSTARQKGRLDKRVLPRPDIARTQETKAFPDISWTALTGSRAKFWATKENLRFWTVYRDDRDDAEADTPMGVQERRTIEWQARKARLQSAANRAKNVLR